MNCQEIIEQLYELSSEKYKVNVVKMGIPESCSIGVSSHDLKKLARKIGKSNCLADELWNTEYHEAKLLAVFIYDYHIMTYQKIESLIFTVDSWDLCNFLCKNLIIKVKGYENFISHWVKSEKTYVKRAGFVLIGSHIIYDSNISEKTMINYLSYIIEYSNDSRIYVKKAIVYALKEIGKKDFYYNEKAILVSYELIQSSNKDQQWVGRNALKELENLVAAKGRTRLISRKSKMGKE
ncbi:DNA alkylation repair protein [Candidatus Stoquefichus massiliensis]|uniref:DNA alkylation repair protein n=1 Tax=Candidatus Stoquefichus massiliensis TaxID=1470350 RepID=UPI0004825B87|nr:DNA alkylation repair protein [Candidatus Stoquefichus massiliensis]